MSYILGPLIEMVKTPVPTPGLKRGLIRLAETEGRSSQGLGARGVGAGVSWVPNLCEGWREPSGGLGG